MMELCKANYRDQTAICFDDASELGSSSEMDWSLRNGSSLENFLRLVWFCLSAIAVQRECAYCRIILYIIL